MKGVDSERGEKSHPGGEKRCEPHNWISEGVVRCPWSVRNTAIKVLHINYEIRLEKKMFIMGLINNILSMGQIYSHIMTFKVNQENKCSEKIRKVPIKT